MLYVFDGGELAPADLAFVRLDDGELAEHRFASAEEVAGILVPRLARRVVAAIRARNADVTLYLEHGGERGPAVR